MKITFLIKVFVGLALFYFIVATFFIHSSHAEMNRILGDEPEITRPTESSNQLIHQKLLGIKCGVVFGPHLGSYQLSGQGFTTSLPSTLGTTLGLNANFHPESTAFEFFIRFHTLSTSYSSVPSILPSETQTTQSGLISGLKFFPMGASESKYLSNLAIGFGYAFNSRRATVTSPNQLNTSMVSSGPLLVLANDFSIMKKYNLELGFEFFIPISYLESGQTSGTFSSSLSYQFSSDLFYKLNESLELGIGFYFGMQRNVFSGTGTRGTTNSDESFVNLGLPIQLRVNL